MNHGRKHYRISTTGTWGRNIKKQLPFPDYLKKFEQKPKYNLIITDEMQRTKEIKLWQDVELRETNAVNLLYFF